MTGAELFQRLIPMITENMSGDIYNIDKVLTWLSSATAGQIWSTTTGRGNREIGSEVVFYITGSLWFPSIALLLPFGTLTIFYVVLPFHSITGLNFSRIIAAHTSIVCTYYFHSCRALPWLATAHVDLQIPSLVEV